MVGARCYLRVALAEWRKSRFASVARAVRDKQTDQKVSAEAREEAKEPQGGTLPDRGLHRFVIDSQPLAHPYEVILAGPLQASDEALPLLVVLDGFLLGMSAIETARLLMAANEIEPVVIAAVSADGASARRTARRSMDFSASVPDLQAQTSIQGVKPQIEASGLRLEDVFGGSGRYRQFLKEELLPAVLEQVKVDVSRLSLFGHSAAGAFALEALLEGDLPFQSYLVGEPGTFMLFGTEAQLLRKALANDALPARRLMYADSSDTMRSNTKHLFEAAELLRAIDEEIGLSVRVHRYEGESHTTMIPAFIKDGLLYLYGTGHTYSETYAERMGIASES